MRCRNNKRVKEESEKTSAYVHQVQDAGRKKLEEKNEEKDGKLVIQMTFPYLFGTTKING